MKVLITGGSRGIGEACVRAFCQRGDSVAFLYRTNHERAKALALETGAIAIATDLSNAELATAATKQAIEALGGIDVLVNNAGISQIKLFGDITDEDWRKMIDTNLSGAFYTSREASRAMVAQHFGRIINVGSMWGKVGASCEVHYSAAKAALIGMTKALAQEVGPSGVRVNCIAPGVIQTDMNAHLDEETIKELSDSTPLMRIGTPDEVARAAHFLCTDASSFITGQVLGVNGGFII